MSLLEDDDEEEDEVLLLDLLLLVSPAPNLLPGERLRRNVFGMPT